MSLSQDGWGEACRVRTSFTLFQIYVLCTHKPCIQFREAFMVFGWSSPFFFLWLKLSRFIHWSLWPPKCCQSQFILVSCTQFSSGGSDLINGTKRLHLTSVNQLLIGAFKIKAKLQVLGLKQPLKAPEASQDKWPQNVKHSRLIRPFLLVMRVWSTVSLHHQLLKST